MNSENAVAKPYFITHTLQPIYNKYSKILILGSFPSVKSRENNFYYGHPQNRFWKVMPYVCTYSAITAHEPMIKEVTTIKQKTKLLLDNNIALWDVVYSCIITGSSDSSIKDVTPINIKQIFDIADIQAVFTNGGIATKLYAKYLEPITKLKAIQLPSTSPANARSTLEKLQYIWSKEISLYLKNQ
jgi:hypoxanthine-DNA glycosylase